MRTINLFCGMALAASAMLAQTTVSIANSGAGTATNLLSCLQSSGAAVTCATSATGVVGICVSTCGTTGNASIAVGGSAACIFDGSTTAGDYVIPSTSTAGDCTDAGANYPSAGSDLVGRVSASHSGGGTYGMVITPPELRPGLPAGTSSTQYGAAYAASASAGALSYTNAGASGALLTGAGSSSPPTFSSNVSVTNVSASGYLQVTGSSPGCLHLEATGNDSEICANASTGNWTLTLPTSGGTNGYPLITDGSGNTSWSQLGNAALTNSSLTVTAGTNLSGGGAVSLGGSTTLSLASPLAANLDLGTSTAEVVEIPNAGTTGTTINKLAKLTGIPSTAVITATTDTNGAVGIVVGGAGTSGNAQIAQSGTASCTFDAGTTAGDYVQISTATGGDCTDAGSGRPVHGQILGRVLSSNGSGGAYAITVWTGMQGSIGSTYAFAGGDLTGTPASATVAKVDGVAYPASPATNTVPVVTGSNTVTYEAVPNSALANSSLTVTAGSNLSGGGAVSLGGSTTLSLASPLTANIDLGASNATAVEIPNASTTGTTVNKLAKLTGAPSTAVITTAGDTGGAIGVVVGGAGTSGNAQIAQSGTASCVFDNSTTAGDYVQISSGTAGDCTDAGATYPPSGEVIGRVLSSGSAGTYQIAVLPGGITGSLAATSVTTNGIAYGASSNTVAFTPSVNSGVLVTSSSGVPSISTSAALTVLASNQAGSTVAAGGAATYFALCTPAGSSPTEPYRRVIVPVAGNLRYFYVVTTTSQPSGAGNTLVFTILKNGIGTSLVVTVGAAAGAGKYSDVTDTVSVVAGDEISVQAKNNHPTLASAAIADMSILLTP